MRIKVKPNTLDLSVVIPTLHEAPNLRKLLPLLKVTLSTLDIQWEILIVDGNSKDDAEEICGVEGARYICEEKPG